MKITKRTREQAALICAIAASNGSDLRESYGLVVLLLDDPGRRLRANGTYNDAHALALSAWAHVADHQYSNTYTHEQPDAEAHALLMSGWSPE